MSTEMTTFSYAADDREWMPRRGVELLWAWWGLLWIALSMPQTVSATLSMLNGGTVSTQATSSSTFTFWTLLIWDFLAVASSVVCVCSLAGVRAVKLFAEVAALVAILLTISHAHAFYVQITAAVASGAVSWSTWMNVASTASYSVASFAWPALGLVLFGPTWLTEKHERRAKARAAFDAEEFAKSSGVKSTDPAPSASAENLRP